MRRSRRAAPAAQVSAYIKDRFTPKSTIASFGIHCQPVATYRPARPKPSFPNCRWVETTPCIHSSLTPKDQCSWMSLPLPIPASRKIGNRKYPARTHALNLRLAVASGVMTRTRPTRRFHQLSVLPPGYATPRALLSTLRAAFLFRSMAEINCIRTGLISIKRTRKPHCPPKK